MTQIYKQRMMAEIEGEFVVFLIGMRINTPWKVHKWLPVLKAMPRMLKELEAHPELGLLGYESALFTVIQYWRSFEHLEAYARSRDHAHLPAWRDFNQRIGYAGGDVGIWHETYRIQPGHYETIYGAMPAYGLGKVGRLVPLTAAQESARLRMQNDIGSEKQRRSQDSQGPWAVSRQDNNVIESAVH